MRFVKIKKFSELQAFGSILISKKFFLVLLFIVSNSASAGGDFVLGKVTEFSGTEGFYRFTFKQSEKHSPLLMRCYEFTVNVVYQRVPWYSWFPFVQSNHPTKQQTIIAGTLLHEAYKSNHALKFGYMGGGLISTDKPCSFSSKGLLLIENDVILSFNDEV